LIKKGVCIVITPLIALMKDQIENLKNRGIQASAVFSGMPIKEVDITLDNCIYGKTKFLYVSPERIQSELFRERVKRMNSTIFQILNLVLHQGDQRCYYDTNPFLNQCRHLKTYGFTSSGWQNGQDISSILNRINYFFL